MRTRETARPYLFALGSLALATGLAFAAAGRPDAAPAPLAAAAPIEEVAPPAPPLPTELPTWASALPGDDGLADATRDAIQHESRAFVKALPEESPLRAALFAKLAGAPRCGRAHAAAVAGAFSEATAREIERTLAAMKTSCDEVIVEAAGFTPNADASLAAKLDGLVSGHGEEASRRAALLSYGSLGETARRSGDGELAKTIDARLVSALASSKGEGHVLAVKAAGNAGCVACAPTLAEDARSKDLGLRRAAVAAHRFLDDAPAVAAMCGALEKDADDAVRDMAAWALEWRGAAPEARAACLEKAARKDPSKRVRMQATLALGLLSDEQAPARAALTRLAGDESLDVQALAARSLEVRGAVPAPLLAAADEGE